MATLFFPWKDPAYHGDDVAFWIAATLTTIFAAFAAPVASAVAVSFVGAGAFMAAGNTYQFQSIPEDTKVNATDNAEFVPQDMIGPKEKLGLSEVWLTVFGVLMKKPQTGGPDESHVMEKAHVVCRAPRTLPPKQE
ncbi:hypothetical protein EPUS_05635 [Endocarpon pusillum Z07020]|uniref:Uncharacterized protein n=1 Tax=Endocarpon pusillum (strain Z07020 / HMAS-L-300199) TaxID=1263415 RepID=U1G9X8_ENDPU|nr:uncharacterized protein EPUS_05635 [Endocarpon pusillum Z07020]ERF68496.1 hypothetical protein EPUS_05635 [Endocarpon pusillum Z07020]